jgi:hypothetical protein
MSYIAKIDDTLISAHRTYKGALKAIMEYEGFTDRQIKKAFDDGMDITNTDSSYQIIETVR